MLKHKPSTKLAHKFKYVFVDVIGYSQEHIEQQSNVTAVLNRIIRSVLHDFGIFEPRILLQVEDTTCLLLPTGDGVCIVIIERRSEQPDIHLTVAEEIARRIYQNNRYRDKGLESWAVRIGVNEHTDEIITDINGRENISGNGINNAQRIMSSGGPNQIVIGESVYSSLSGLKRYSTTFREHTFVDKHGVVHRAYRYVKPNTPWIQGKVEKKQELEVITDFFRSKMPGSKESYFKMKVLQWRARLLMERVQKLNNKDTTEFECRDDYSNMIYTFMGLISELEEGDTYYTLSSLKFWKRLQYTRGHFLDENMDAVARGVKIHRLIIMDKRILSGDQEPKSAFSIEDVSHVVSKLTAYSKSVTGRKYFKKMDLLFVPVDDYPATYRDEIPWAIAEHKAAGRPAERVLMQPIFKDDGAGVKSVKVEFDDQNSRHIAQLMKDFRTARQFTKYDLGQMRELLEKRTKASPVVHRKRG